MLRLCISLYYLISWLVYSCTPMQLFWHLKLLELNILTSSNLTMNIWTFSDTLTFTVFSSCWLLLWFWLTSWWKLSSLISSVAGSNVCARIETGTMCKKTQRKSSQMTSMRSLTFISCSKSIRRLRLSTKRSYQKDKLIWDKTYLMKTKNTLSIWLRNWSRSFKDSEVSSESLMWLKTKRTS